MSDLLPNYDTWLDAPLRRREREDVEPYYKLFCSSCNKDMKPKDFCTECELCDECCQEFYDNHAD